jgi:hypothetical protein
MIAAIMGNGTSAWKRLRELCPRRDTADFFFAIPAMGAYNRGTI